MAPSYLAGLAIVLVNALSYIGITVGTDELTTTLQTLATIGLGLFIMIRQIVTGKSTPTGSRPE